MKKKYLAVAVGSALLMGGSMSANAAFIQNLSLSGDFLVDGFEDAPDDVFTISLSNLSGMAEFNIPPDGPLEVYLTGQVAVDYDGVPGPDFGNTYNNFLAYDGFFSSSNITSNNFSFDFDTGTFLADGTPITGGSFQLDYDASIMGLVASLIGLPLLNTPGAGELDITYTLAAGSMEITVVDNYDPATWSGFENFLNLLENSPLGGLDNGQIDGSFAIGNSVTVDPGTGNLVATGDFGVNVTAVPVPAPLALIGLGLLGMGVMRRRQAA